MATALLSPAGVDGRVEVDPHTAGAVPPVLLAELRETHRQRQDLLRAEVRLTNQIEAIHRRLTGLRREERGRALAKARKAAGGDQSRGVTLASSVPAAAAAGADRGYPDPLRAAVRPDAGAGVERDPRALLPLEAAAGLAAEPLVEARDLLRGRRRAWDKRLERLSRELPVWAWAASVRGLGALSLGQIVGETGDLALYDGPAKVWKRMGLAVIDGERQRKHTDPTLAALHGYDPTRRSIMYVVADNLVKLNDGAYRAYYDAEKARQREKWPDLAPYIVDAKAKRHLAKRLLRDLWRAWRTPGPMPPGDTLSAPAPADPAG